MSDPYQVLGVSPDADQSTLKSAWRRRSRETHPDVGGDAAAFQEVQDAWQLLSDTEARSRFDARNAKPGGTSAGADPAAGRAASGQESTWSSERADMWAGAAHAAGGPRAGATDPRARGAGAAGAPRGARRPEERPAPTMTVDPQRLSWAAHRAPEAVQVVPHQLAWLPRVPLLAAGAAIVAWLALVLHAFGSAPAPQLSSAAGLLLLGVTAGAAATRWWPASAAAAAIGVGMGWYGWFHSGWVDVLLWLVALAAVAASIGARCARMWRSPRGLDDVVDEDTARRYNVFGTPGAPGHLDAEVKRTGARMGDDALLPLTWFPSVRTFHAPPFNAAGHATSHVVVCGNRVAVVETLVWVPGTYDLSAHGALRHDGAHFAYGDVVIGEAVAQWRQRVPSGTEVRGWVMVGSTLGEVRTAASGPGDVRVGTPQQVVEEIGSWFAAGDVSVVDRRVLLPFATALVA